MLIGQPYVMSGGVRLHPGNAWLEAKSRLCSGRISNEF